ncbi:MAG: DEAD/DEAH box helicase, partial [Aquificae bacterium]|nr:DEAD/DEAH box helicase [Aquificota bacterium]
MKNLKQAKAIIDKVKNYDDKLLERTTGLSETLSSLLQDYLPSGLLEDVKQIDGLTPPKKRALLDYLSKAVDQAVSSEGDREGKKEEKKEKKKVFLPLEDFFQIQVKDVQILKPIEKRAFKKVGAETVYDALFFFPRRYEDKRLKDLSSVKEGESGLFRLKVVDVKKVKKGKLKTQVVLKQGNKTINAYFVHDKPFLFTFFRKGREVLLYGKVSRFGRELSMVQPEIHREEDPVVLNRIVPVYSLRGDSSVKITSQTINHLRRGMHKLIQKYLPYFPEYLPEEIYTRYRLPQIREALALTHFPEGDLDAVNSFETRPQLRMIFDELFILELAQSYRKAIIRKNPATPINVPPDFMEKFQSVLPFQLTEDQKKALLDIFRDISKPYPMNRMVQGDVGSGKTMVAVGSSLAVALDGKQVAVMAPTEILAQQHYRNFKAVFDRFSIPVYLLTGSTSQKEKREIYEKMETGEAKVVIGTHALIQEEVRFKELSLVIVDEQHRFGVEQRKALIEKSGKMPHVLVMTATPIPRTLTLALYGDLDVSIIKQMPAGRKPVKTVLYYEDEREIMIGRI